MQAYGIFEHHRERTPTGGGLVPIKVYKTERGADAYVDRKYRERVGS